MSAPSVLESPQSYDYFTLNGERSPGIAKITSGGGRKVVIEDQGQFLTFGKNSVVRNRENAVLTYSFKLWLPGHFDTKRRWQAMFEAGSNKVNPTPYAFQDLNVNPAITKVIFEDENPQQPDAPGGPWQWVIVLHEYKRIKKAGGPVIPLPGDDLAKRIGDDTADVNNRIKQLESKAAARRGPVSGQAGLAPPGKK